MLDAPTATIVAALIALVGTLAGASAAYRRWTRERRTQRFARFEADRQDVYKTMWDRVEQINAQLRRGRVDETGFPELVADLNEFLIRSSAHVDDDDYRRANEYVTAVKAFHELVAALPPQDQVSYGQTQTIPPEVVRRVRELAEAQQAVIRLRDELRDKVRHVIGGV